MTDLFFKLTVNYEDDPTELVEFGKELAVFFGESLFNGEDIVDVEFLGGKIVKEGD